MKLTRRSLFKTGAATATLAGVAIVAPSIALSKAPEEVEGVDYIKVYLPKGYEGFDQITIKGECQFKRDGSEEGKHDAYIQQYDDGDRGFTVMLSHIKDFDPKGDSYPEPRERLKGGNDPVGDLMVEARDAFERLHNHPDYGKRVWNEAENRWKYK